MMIGQVSVGVMDKEEPEMARPVGTIEGNSTIVNTMDEAIRRAKAQDELNAILKRREQEEAFTDPESDALMCRRCNMPCYDDMHTSLRRAYPMGGGTVVCNECLGR